MYIAIAYTDCSSISVEFWYFSSIIMCSILGMEYIYNIQLYSYTIETDLWCMFELATFNEQN